MSEEKIIEDDSPAGIEDDLDILDDIGMPGELGDGIDLDELVGGANIDDLDDVLAEQDPEHLTPEQEAARSKENLKKLVELKGKSKKKTRKKSEFEDYKAFMPPEIIGGSVPYLPGTEKEAVWNAAAQACGTDNVSFVFTIDEGRCWYLACPSASLASQPKSWCPLAAALPGNSEYWDRETVHIYEAEGMVAALRWDEQTEKMQLYVGPSRTILPRLQSMDANFVTINEEKAKVVPWTSLSWEQEKLSRLTVKYLFFSGLAVAMVAIFVWFAANFWAITLRPDLTKAKAETSSASMDLVMKASQAVGNEANKHITRLQELLGDMNEIGGTLVKYEINEENNSLTWEALVPSALSTANLNQFRARTIGRAPDGRLRIRGSQ